jgi:hypothetical protein
MLRPIATALSVAEQPLRFYGVPVGARMTVVQLGGGGVLLYSPIAATPGLQEAVSALGEVRFILAPNRFHHLFAAEWQKAAPAAETWIAAGLVRKRKELGHTGTLDARATPLDRDVAHHAMRGAPILDETVILHKPTRTLVCCDLVHNVAAQAPFGQRLFMRLLGGYGGVKTSLLDRAAVKDRAAARASVDTILSWDFDRIVMAHGVVCESGGKEALRAAYAWL